MADLIQKRDEFKQPTIGAKTVSIEQYFDPETPNLGLEKYGLSMFEGGGFVEDLGYTTFGDQIRYITGLDEFSDEVRNIEDPEERDARMQQIREARAYLEKYLGEGVLDPLNTKFWSKVKLEVKTRRKYLDLKDPYDLIYYFAIKAGGFSGVAPSFEAARNHPTIVYKYYLQELEEFAAVKTELTKQRNAAKAKLHEIYMKDPKRLVKIAKVLLHPRNNFKFTTPVDLIYEKLDELIEGTIVKTNKKATPKEFLSVADLDKTTLHLRALVIDAIHLKYIVPRSDGFYYNFETGSMCGKNIPEIIEFLRNPLNQSDYTNLSERVESKWNK